ncbi:hypothetical protein B1T51_20860 [Mycobacterium kansasii]|nr:hypothetical protein B1T47_07165 [Mycobacterium kansasii]ARG76515.1 hypothetical protein B1T51_20860 [Mycobacterium kansasii]ORC12904.1 hypothetical protein B1T46_21215 [Mycobacterium kansasii]
MRSPRNPPRGDPPRPAPPSLRSPRNPPRGDPPRPAPPSLRSPLVPRVADVEETVVGLDGVHLRCSDTQ